MHTITLWLLIAHGQISYQGRPPQIVERFAEQAECQRIADMLNGPRRPDSVCVRATVAVTRP